MPSAHARTSGPQHDSDCDDILQEGHEKWMSCHHFAQSDPAASHSDTCFHQRARPRGLRASAGTHRDHRHVVARKLPWLHVFRRTCLGKLTTRPPKIVLHPSPPSAPPSQPLLSTHARTHASTQTHHETNNSHLDSLHPPSLVTTQQHYLAKSTGDRKAFSTTATLLGARLYSSLEERP